VRAGHGGAGSVSFRREKFVPRGGPDGGDGGRGGSVILEADPSLATLLDFRYRPIQAAKNGRPGEGSGCDGADGGDLVVRVPVGTEVRDASDDSVIGDLTEAGQRMVIARGGRGGLGNRNFATPSRQAPDYAQPGETGEELEIVLVLKLMADVGLVGFPNAGKSTLVSVMSRARPKIADYPFTTLSPNLGVVRVDDDRSYVMADIPGIIEGAADGAGLGLRFLKHIERTGLFLYLITQDLDPARDPLSDFRALRKELGQHDPALLSRPALVVLSQADRPEVEGMSDEVRAALEPDGHEVLVISAVSGAGMDALRRAIAQRLAGRGRWG
jgi:GTP-binding protein